MNDVSNRWNPKDTEASKDSYIKKLLQSEIIPNPDDVDDFPFRKGADTEKYEQHLLNAPILSLNHRVVSDENLLTLPDWIKETEGNRKANKGAGFWETAIKNLDENNNIKKR